MDDRKHGLEVHIAASPEAVWEAISTGEGLVRWFTPEARVEPGPGGKVWLKWTEGMESSSEVLEWEPGKRLVMSAGGQTIAFYLEGQGGMTTLRLVHSGFSADSKFDDEFEATYGGWSTYLAVLNHVVSVRPGEPVLNVLVMRTMQVKRAALLPLVMDPERILGEKTHELARPANGYLVATVPGLADSPVAVFCEAFGETTCVSVAAYLVGDAGARADEVRSRIAAFLDAVKPAQSTEPQSPAVQGTDA